MTPKEAFKIGFLEKCAEAALSPEETLARIKHAQFMVKSGLGETLVNFLSNLFSTAWPAALVVPPVAGLAGGAMLAQAQNDDYQEEEAQRRELVGAYDRAVSKLERLQRKRMQDNEAI
jgi:hypothetical protein